MPKERLRVTTKEHGNQNTSPYPTDNINKEISEVHNSAPLVLSAMDNKVSPTPSNEKKCIQSDNQTNLIVNYLPQTMTQEDIRLLFASVGELESCKLIRDKTTGQSLGYGFVDYKRSENAHKAISSFNGLRLQNKAIKVSFARPSSDMIKGANLYISGLSKNINSQALTAMLSRYGQIITSRVLCDPHTGQSKGVGFIRFNLKSEAEEAIKQLNGTTPEGSTEPITVKFANQPTISVKAQAAQVALSKPLPLSALTLTPQLNQVLIQPAPLYAALQPGTVRYQSMDGVLPMTASVGQCNVLPQPPVNNSSTWCLFVFNLPPDIDDNTLWTLFGRFGAVQSARVVRDGGVVGKSKGFGFVNMLNYEDCLTAIASLDGYQIDCSHVIRVSFKRSSPPLGSVPTYGMTSQCVSTCTSSRQQQQQQQAAVTVAPREQFVCSTATPVEVQTIVPQGVQNISGFCGSFDANSLAGVIPTGYIGLPAGCFNGYTQAAPLNGYTVI